MKDGIKLIYLHEDAGRITDTGVYLAPGVENVVEVGKHLSGELAAAFVERGICGVHDPAANEANSSGTGEELPEMPWLNPAEK